LRASRAFPLWAGQRYFNFQLPRKLANRGFILPRCADDGQRGLRKPGADGPEADTSPLHCNNCSCVRADNAVVEKPDGRIMQHQQLSLTSSTSGWSFRTVDCSQHLGQTIRSSKQNQQNCCNRGAAIESLHGSTVKVTQAERSFTQYGLAGPYVGTMDTSIPQPQCASIVSLQNSAPFELRYVPT
jgi:hypothetical protein